jgi:hypothetical protein
MIFIGKTVVGQTLTKKLDKVVCAYPNFNQMVDPNTSNQKETSNFNLLYFIKGH